MKATQQKAEVVELVSLTIPDWGEVPREEEAGSLKSLKDTNLIRDHLQIFFLILRECKRIN